MPVIEDYIILDRKAKRLSSRQQFLHTQAYYRYTHALAIAGKREPPD